MTGSRGGAVGLGPEGPKSLPVHVADAAARRRGEDCGRRDCRHARP